MKKAITCVHRGGFGAQYHACMSGFAFSRFYDIPYFHTPFFRMEHDLNPLFFDNFTGLQSDPNIRVSRHSLMAFRFAKEVHNSVRPSKYYTDSVRNYLRQYYLSTPKPPSIPCDIAIHIRRGDVNAYDPKVKDRFAPLSYYSRLIKLILEINPSAKILIFSEGKISYFTSLELPDTCFCLNYPLDVTFHTMALSPCLIMGKSSLSYAAALLNPNQIIYCPMHHNPLDHWLGLTKNNHVVNCF